MRVIATGIEVDANSMKQYARGNSALFLADGDGAASYQYNINGTIPINYVVRPNGIIFHGCVSYCEAQIIAWIDSCLLAIEEENGKSTEQTPALVLSPNPFKIAMMISVKGVKTAGDLQIQDLTGRVVKSFSLAPNSTIRWDRKDNSGKEVSVGMYFCRFNNGTVNLTGKAVIFK